MISTRIESSREGMSEGEKKDGKRVELERRRNGEGEENPNEEGTEWRGGMNEVVKEGRGSGAWMRQREEGKTEGKVGGRTRWHLGDCGARHGGKRWASGSSVAGRSIEGVGCRLHGDGSLQTLAIATLSLTPSRRHLLPRLHHTPP